MDKTASFNNQFRLAHKCILLRTRPMTGPIFLSRTNPCMTPMTNKTSGKFLFAIHPFVHSFLGRSRVVVSYLKPFPAHPLTRTICGWYGFNMRRWRQWNQSKGNQNRIKCYSSLYPSLARTHWSIHSIPFSRLSLMLLFVRLSNRRQSLLVSSLFQDNAPPQWINWFLKNCLHSPNHLLRLTLPSINARDHQHFHVYLRDYSSISLTRQSVLTRV